MVEIGRRMAESLRSGGKVLIFGNGGSAADAQHFAAELWGASEGSRGLARARPHHRHLDH